MILAVALTAMLGTADDGRGFAPSSEPRSRFGITAGLGVGLRGPGDRWWVTSELSGAGVFWFGPTSLRLGGSFRFGGTDDYVPMAVTAFVAGLEFRIHPVARFSFGLGVESGLLLYGASDVRPLLSPIVTLGAFRLGERLQHEVALAANLLWSFETDRNCGCYGSAYLQGGFAIVRYTFGF